MSEVELDPVFPRKPNKVTRYTMSLKQDTLTEERDEALAKLAAAEAVIEKVRAAATINIEFRAVLHGGDAFDRGLLHMARVVLALLPEVTP